MNAPDTFFASRPAAAAAARTSAHRVRVWDLPLRLFHWALLACVATAIVSGELGGDLMTLHAQAGLAVVGLLAFRLVWGLIGSETARFTQFAPTPGRLRAYLGGRWHGRGHNPLGALSVFALLGLLSVQAVTGLFGNDEISVTGPLNALVAEELGLRLTSWHKQLALGLFVLLGLHLAAIVFHAVVKRHNLVRPMLTGWADPHPAAAAAPAQAASPADTPGRPLAWWRPGGPLALGLALAGAALAVWVARGGPWA